ncbi:MAG: hypothetical protein QXU54_02010 [Candidatus Micrarchaeia archaeon]
MAQEVKERAQETIRELKADIESTKRKLNNLINFPIGEKMKEELKKDRELLDYFLDPDILKKSASNQDLLAEVERGLDSVKKRLEDVKKEVYIFQEKYNELVDAGLIEGRKIDVDGAVGPKTNGALKKVVAALGLEGEPELATLVEKMNEYKEKRQKEASVPTISKEEIGMVQPVLSTELAVKLQVLDWLIGNGASNKEVLDVLQEIAKIRVVAPDKATAKEYEKINESEVKKFGNVYGLYLLSGGNFPEFAGTLANVIKDGADINYADTLKALNRNAVLFTYQSLGFPLTGTMGGSYDKLQEYARMNTNLGGYIDAFVKRELNSVALTENLTVGQALTKYKERGDTLDKFIIEYQEILRDARELRSYKAVADFIKRLDIYFTDKLGVNDEKDYAQLYRRITNEEFDKNSIGYLLLTSESKEEAEKRAREIYDYTSAGISQYRQAFNEAMAKSNLDQAVKNVYTDRANRLFNSGYFEQRYILFSLEMSAAKGASIEKDMYGITTSSLFGETINGLYLMSKLHPSLLPKYVALQKEIIGKAKTPADAARLLRTVNQSVEDRVATPTFESITYVGDVLDRAKDNLRATKSVFDRFETLRMLAVEDLRSVPLEETNLAVAHTPLLRTVAEMSDFQRLQYSVGMLGILAGQDYRAFSRDSEEYAKGKFTLKYSPVSLYERAKNELRPRNYMMGIEPQVSSGMDVDTLTNAINRAFVESDVKFTRELYREYVSAGGAMDAEIGRSEAGGEVLLRGAEGASLFVGGTVAAPGTGVQRIYEIGTDGELREKKLEIGATAGVEGEAKSAQERLGEEDKGLLRGEERVRFIARPGFGDAEIAARDIAKNVLEKGSEVLLVVRVRNVDENGYLRRGGGETGGEVKFYYTRPDGTVQEAHFSEPVEEYLKKYAAARLDVSEANLFGMVKTIPATSKNFVGEAVAFDLKGILEYGESHAAAAEIYRGRGTSRERDAEYWRNISNKFDRLFKDEWGVALGHSILGTHAIGTMYSGYTRMDYDEAGRPIRDGTSHYERLQYFWYPGKGATGRLTAYAIGGWTDKREGHKTETKWAGLFGGLEASFYNRGSLELDIEKGIIGLLGGYNSSNGEKIARVLLSGQRIYDVINWFIEANLGMQFSEEYKVTAKLVTLHHTLKAAGFDEKEAWALSLYTLNRVGIVRFGLIYRNSRVFRELNQMYENYNNVLYRRGKGEAAGTTALDIDTRLPAHQMTYFKDGKAIDVTVPSVPVKISAQAAKDRETLDRLLEREGKVHDFQAVAAIGSYLYVGGGLDIYKDRVESGGGQLVVYMGDTGLYAVGSARADFVDTVTGMPVTVTVGFGLDGTFRIDLGISKYDRGRLNDDDFKNLVGRVLFAAGDSAQTLVSLSAGGSAIEGGRGTGELWVGWKDGALTHFTALNVSGTAEKEKVGGGFSVVASYGAEREMEDGKSITYSFDLVFAGEAKKKLTAKDAGNLIRDMLGAQAVVTGKSRTLVDTETWGGALAYVPPGIRPEATRLYTGNLDPAVFFSRMLSVYGYYSVRSVKQ